MPTDAYQTSLEDLKTLGPMRVWSVLVTVFGDLAPEQPIAGPTLSKLMAEIGIKPEATRVALHRLRADGWIVTKKMGRYSQHSLSAKARVDSENARRQIYGPPPESSKLIFFLLPPNSATATEIGVTQVSPRLYVSTSVKAVPHGALRLTADGLAPWIAATVETDPTKRGYARIIRVLGQIDTSLSSAAVQHPVQRAALRVLVVHAWRRLALKHALLPRDAHSAEWRGHDARALVTTLLERFDKPSLDEMNLG